MGVRERILVIRLLEKVNANPSLAAAFASACDDEDGSDSEQNL